MFLYHAKYIDRRGDERGAFKQRHQGDQRSGGMIRLASHTARPASSQRYPRGRLLPAIRAATPPTTAERRALTAAARAAAAGDRAWRDALYYALEDWIETHVERWRRLASRSDGSWDLEDVRQEAYLAFADFVAAWDEEGDFFEDLNEAFDLALRHAVRQFFRRAAQRAPVGRLAPLHDGTADAEASLALLESIAADLPSDDARLLLARVRDRAGFDAIARQLGVNRRSVHRHWNRITAELRTALESERPSGG
jgi:DNA-directed RNA polymerase specialized sigma24 family protein